MRKNPGKNEEEQKEILYQKTQMHRDRIFRKLREQGCRITRQRRMLLDIILEGDCSCCKEIYYKALKADEKIGVATVYRMINALEEIGAISRKNMYKVECSEDCGAEGEGCRIVLDDCTTCHLSPGNWNKVVREGMRRYGYLKDQKIMEIKIQR